MEKLEERLVLDVSAPAILQVFDSTYANIEDRAVDIFNAGYGGVWIPPTGRADSGNQSVGYDVFDRFDLGSPGNPTLYGTETGLKTLVDKAHDAGLAITADFVINHNGFRDASTPDFVSQGGYPGFALTLNSGNNSLGFDDVDGDFHGAFEGGDLNGRLSGLIDIAHEKNFQFVRHPVDASDPNNILGGSIFNVPDPNNARFYPDQDLPPIFLFDPKTGETNIPVYPFNNATPLEGDAVTENAMGLLMRNAQWLVQSIGIDNFRIDAAKHVEPFVLEFFDRAVYRADLDSNLDGSRRDVFSFSEIFTGDRAFIQSLIRKDIDPADPGRIGGNRDALDFPLFFAMLANLTDNGFTNDWRNIKNASQDVQDDGLANNGSQGVAFVSSHDEHGPFLENVAHAFVLMRPGNAVVYFNAEEFGQGRDFPKDGRGDALGGQFGDTITTLVNIRNTHGRGDYIDRTDSSDEKEMLVFERSASALTVLSNRVDGGFDERTFQTNFAPGTPLIDLTGNSANATIDPFNDFPEVVVVNGDGTVNLRVPRNVAPNGVQHNTGYFIYGPSGPQGTLSLTNVASTIAPETATPETNGTSRIGEIDVITTDSFDVQLDTIAVNHLGTIRDQFADGDNALIKIDEGMDLNGNSVIDFTTPDEVVTGFEEFTTFKQPGFFETDGNGQYIQTIDATTLSEGTHHIEVRAFRHREPGEGDAIYTPFKRTVYIDRLPPESVVDSFDPLVSGINENRQLRIRSTDLTADNVHIFYDLPAAVTDAEILALLDGNSQGNRLDRDLWSKDLFGVTSGNHVVTFVTFEKSGNVSIERTPGLSTSTIFGAGLGDVDFDGDIDNDDFTAFAVVANSGNAQFNPAADFNADGLVDVLDLSLFHRRLLDTGADAATLDAFEAMVDTVADLDYGDAPESAALPGFYPTLRASDGARHILNVGPFLGAGVDAEADGVPSTNADGDDLDGNNDEDGVALPSRFLAGRTVSIDVQASGSGLLNAFVDFNADGDFVDSGEQIATDLAVTGGSNSLSISVPIDATTGPTYGRFRIDSFGGLGADDLASDGEVEDYAITIEAAQATIVDDTQSTATVDGLLGTSEYIGSTTGVGSSFGDVIGANSTLAIDSSGTGTLSFALNASNTIGGGNGNDVVVIYIDNGSGTGVTSTASIANFNGRSERAISGNASVSAGDESDLSFAKGFTASHAFAVEAGFIGLWSIANDGSITFEAGRTNDGSFDAGLLNLTTSANGNLREWSLDLSGIGVNQGDSFKYVATYISDSGFRSNEFNGVDATTIKPPLAADPHIGANPFALLGSDYNVFVTVPAPQDYGDAPTSGDSGFAASYPVTVLQDGARHVATGPTLGPTRDIEDDGQPFAGALGDDNSDGDDEDGITFVTSTLVSSATGTRTGQVTVDLQNADGVSNRLDAWIDFNHDGDWNDPGEQIFVNFDLGTSNGAQTLSFTIPQDLGSNLVTGTTYARFRLSTAGGLNPISAAADGEVEDVELSLLGELTLSIADGTISENGGTTIGTLTRSEATSQSTVTLTNGDNSEISLPATIQFPPGQTSTTVTITGSDDDIVDGTISGVSIGAALAGFTSTSTTIDVTDDEMAGFTISESDSSTVVTEGGSTDSLTVALTDRPQTDVVLTLMTSDATEAAIDVTSITFTTNDWNQARTVNVSTTDDDFADGDQSSTITVSIDAANSDDFFDSLMPQTVSVTSNDDEVAGFTIVESLGATVVSETGLADTFSVVLDARPVAPVVIDVNNPDTSEIVTDKTSLNFDSSNWSTPQVVTVTGQDDIFGDGDQVTPITLSIDDSMSHDVYDAVADQTVQATTTDDDSAAFIVTESGGSTSVGEPGTTDTFDVVLTIPPETQVVFVISSDDPTESDVDQSTLTFDSMNWNVPQTVTVNAVDDLLVDGDQASTITIAVDDANSDNGFDPLDDQTIAVTTTDNDIAGFVVTESDGDTTVSEPAGTDSLSIVLSAGPLTDVVIDLTNGDPNQISLDKNSLTFTPSNWMVPQTVTVTAVDDDIVDLDRTVSVTASVASGSNAEFVGLPNQSVSVSALDDDVPTFSITSPDNITEGGSTTAIVSRNTLALDAVTATLQNSAPSELIALDEVSFPVGVSTREIILVSVDDAIVDGNSTTTLTATGNGFVSGSKTLTILDNDAPTLALFVSPAQFLENSQAIVTVVRNTNPTDPLTITLANSNPTGVTVPSSVTIPAGESSHSFVITGVDDLIAGQSRSSMITASAAGFASSTKTVQIADNDVEALTLAIDRDSIVETGGTATASVSRNSVTDAALVVVPSGSSSRISQPASITIPVGSTSASFIVSGVDDEILNSASDLAATVTVSSGDFVPGSDSLEVLDDESNQLPTLDEIADLVLNSGNVLQTVSLAGISPGDMETQDVRITAISSNASIVSSINVDFTDGATGSLTFTPTLDPMSTSTTITVTVEDDGLDGDFGTSGDNRSISREFTVSLASDPVIDVVNDAPTAADFELRRNGEFLEFLIDGNISSTLLFAQVTSFHVEGNDVDNRLLVDFSGGNPIPTGGLNYSGGLQTESGGDSLELTGGSFSEIAHRFVDANSGTIDIDGSAISYDGLEPIIDSLMAGVRVFEFSSANDIVTIADDENAANGMARISSAGTSELVDFVIPSQVLFIDTGAGNDQVTMSNLETSPPTLAVQGNAGNDMIIGSDADEILMGGAGRDVIQGGAGNDVLLGAGASGDDLSGGPGDDVIDGGGGNDIVSDQGDVNFTLTSTSLEGLGTDTLRRVERARLVGGDSANRIDATGFLTGFEVSLFGGAGDDELLGSIGADLLVGGAGNDTAHGGDGPDGILGQAGIDQLFGGEGNDFIKAHGGSKEIISGGPGDDFLDGGAGGDRLFEQADTDFTLTSTSATRATLAGLGNDNLRNIEIAFLNGGPSANTIDITGFVGSWTLIQGLGGDDIIIGSATADVIFGGDGDDNIKGRDGNDILSGDNGDDLINGGSGDDHIEGGRGSDGLSGFTGNDQLFGDNANDILFGGAGNDILKAGAGNDIAIGGDDADEVDGELDVDILVGGNGTGTPDPGDNLIGDPNEIDETFQLSPIPDWVNGV